MPNANAGSGLNYLFRGAGLIMQPGLRRFAILPLLVNFVLFVAAFIWMISQLSAWSDALANWFPDYLSWLAFLLWPLAILAGVLIFNVAFATVAGFIAAPFNGLLAEQVEKHLTGQSLDGDNFSEMLKDTPRIMKRELQKITYSLPRLLGCFLLFFVPIIGQTIAPILWFLLGAWLLTIQYADYPFDNHKVAFGDMRKALWGNKSQSLMFGGLLSLLMFVPFLNLVIMPIAVCGATAAWVDHYRQDFARKR